MKRIVFLVVICVLLIGLALPSCGPGTGEESLNLQPGGIVTGVDGVSVGAPEGALDQAIEILIEKVGDPREEVPFPEYLAGAEVVGNFYAVSAERDFSTPDGNYLLLGLPVPKGVSTDDLVILSLVRRDWTIMDEPDDFPSPPWIPVLGYYDTESGLFGTLLPSVRTEPEPEVWVLVKGLRVDFTQGGLFTVVSIGFGDNESPETHRLMTLDALNAAHNAYIGMGFRVLCLRHRVVYMVFGRPAYHVAGYEYQLHKAFFGRPGGFYDLETRTAATHYLGAPAQPNPITARHELFHAIQYAYKDLRNNYSSCGERWWLTCSCLKCQVKRELNRTIEAGATAAELSLDGLTRSKRPLDGRNPLPVTQGLWFSRTSVGSTTAFDYAAQDFLVYIGKRINPTNPQLTFMIPWFERGGLVADLDAVLQADPTFDSLGDAYWQWAKNHAFEKQVILGKDKDGKDVPYGDPCSWSQHGDLEQVSYSPEAWTWGDAATNFTLGPLTSKVFKLTLNPGDDSDEVKATVDSADPNIELDPDIEFKFYDGGEAGGEGCWDCARDSVAHTFYVGGQSVTGYLLVSNTNMTEKSDPISLETVVEFPDTGLEAAVRIVIWKGTGDIYKSDLKELTSLSAVSENISDPTGLEHCTNLTTLYLWDNQISDISPLSSLINLTALNLNYNQISDISPLSSLINLTRLYIWDNQISDISPLANLTNLTELYLSLNQISDISPLANLTNLTELSFDWNQISDISPLANLTNLGVLGLYSNQISDISPLVNNQGLSEGDWVDLRYNPLSDTSLEVYIPQLVARGVDVYWGEW